MHPDQRAVRAAGEGTHADVVAHQGDHGPEDEDTEDERDDAPRAVLQRVWEGAMFAPRQKVDVQCARHDDQRQRNVLLAREPCGEGGQRTYGGDKERNEGCVVPPSNTVIQPLAMVVASVNAIVTLWEIQ